MSGIVYGLIDGDTLELRYVGQTINTPEERLRGHRRGGMNKHLDSWLRSANVNIIVLERDPVDLNDAEMCWIADMREQGANLLNLTDGGGGSVGFRHSPETRARMIGINKGRILSPEHRTKISAAVMGFKHTPEARAKISMAQLGNQKSLGYKHTHEARIKISAASVGNQSGLGYKHTPEARSKISEALRHRHDESASGG